MDSREFGNEQGIQDLGLQWSVDRIQDFGCLSVRSVEPGLHILTRRQDMGYVRRLRIYV